MSESFDQKLAELEQAFSRMEPELCETVRDDQLGVEGYVVVWNTAIGAGGPLGRVGKGGTRCTPTLNLNELKMLARTMALKNAAAGLPMGGAKSGLRADPDDPAFEKKYRRFVSLCKPFLAENGGIFGGFGFDIGSRPVHALWACDELQSTRSFTGKPVSMGGTDYDREGIAGLGVSVAAVSTLERYGSSPVGCSFAVQGIGAMGAAVIRYFGGSGASLRALADPRCGGSWRLTKGGSPELFKALSFGDIAAVIELLPREGTLVSEDSQAVLFEDVQVLFPCAVQQVIRSDNVADIRAALVIEGANGPVTAEARRALHERGIKLVPDFIANPGGIIAAFVELTSLTEDKVSEAKQFTESKIRENVGRLWDLVEAQGVEPQRAGMFMALSAILGRDRQGS